MIGFPPGAVGIPTSPCVGGQVQPQPFMAIYDPNRNALLVPMMPPMALPQQMGGQNFNVPMMPPQQAHTATDRPAVVSARKPAGSDVAIQEKEMEVAPLVDDAGSDEISETASQAQKKESPAEKAKRLLNVSPAQVMARRKQLLGTRWRRADDSAFSALNIETAKRIPDVSPLTTLGEANGLATVETKGLAKDLRKPSKSLIPMCGGKPDRQTSTTSDGSTCAEGSFGLDFSRDTTVETLQEDESGSGDEPTERFHQVRNFLLAYRRAVRGAPVPTELIGFKADFVPDEPCSEAGKAVEQPSVARSSPQINTMNTMMPPRQISAPMMPIPRQVSAPLQGPLSSPFKRQVSVSLHRQVSVGSEFKRAVQSMLNKICPENIATLAEKIACLEIKSSVDLEILTESVFKKALAEPHYSETYADLAFSLVKVVPDIMCESGEALNFRKALLNSCQSALEELSEACVQAKDDPELFQERAQKMRALMRFIGNLFTRQLLPVKVIGAVLRELVCYGEIDILPGEHAVDGACELLLSVGHSLDQLSTGTKVLDGVCARLLELKGMKNCSGRGVFSKRVQFMIQDLLETRAAQWAKKTFKNTAKTKEEIRLEQTRDLMAKAKGIDSGFAEVVIAGQRKSVHCVPQALSA